VHEVAYLNTSTLNKLCVYIIFGTMGKWIIMLTIPFVYSNNLYSQSSVLRV